MKTLNTIFIYNAFLLLTFCFVACKKENISNSDSQNNQTYNYKLFNDTVRIDGNQFGVDVNGDGQADVIFSSANDINPITGFRTGDHQSIRASDALVVQVKCIIDYEFDVTLPKRGMLNSYKQGDTIDSLTTSSIYFDSQGFIYDLDIGYNYGKFNKGGLGYFGFRVKDSAGLWHYGWGSIITSPNGGSFILKEFCFKNNANESIVVGEH